MPMRALLLSLGFAVALAGCQRDAADTTTPTPAKSPVTASTSHDALSYAETGKVAITDLALDLKVDFDTKPIAGTATYTLDWKDEDARQRSEEHTSELQSLMSLSYAVFCLNKKTGNNQAIHYGRTTSTKL